MLAAALAQPVLSVDWAGKLDHWVNDFAGLLPPGDRERIDARLREYQQSSGNHVLVAIFPSLEGDSLERFVLEVAEKVGIGEKETDKGVLLAIFVQDKKMRIEVGYGLEGALTDAESGRIIRDVIAPAFRQQRYAEGVSDAVERIIAETSGEATPPPPRRARRGLRPELSALLIIVLFLIIFLTGIGRTLFSGPMTFGGPGRRIVRRRGWYGGGWGGGGWGVGGGGWGGGGGWSGGGGGGGGGGYSGGGGSFGGGGASGGW